MAEPWSKEADWIPFTNALAQVLFWKEDLVKIEKSLAMLEEMGIPKTDNGYLLTLREIKASKRGLKVAQFKLKRSFARLTWTDIVNFGDKLNLDKLNEI